VCGAQGLVCLSGPVVGEERGQAFVVWGAMSYDEVEIEDMQWSDDLAAFTYPCPCGDLFQITLVSYVAS
jgi:hypothetical protein